MCKVSCKVSRRTRWGQYFMSKKSQKGKLTHAPVSYALAQVRFSPVLKLDKFIPEIQDRLRGEYPRYEKGEVRNIQIGPSGPPIIAEPESRWIFLNKNRTCGVVLQHSSFIYHTTAYETSDQFRERIMAALEPVADSVTLTLIERVGLRYIDLVIPDSDESLGDYLHASLTGFPFEEHEAEKELNFAQATAKTKIGQLVVRCLVNKAGLLMPDDLMPCPLSIERNVPRGRFTAVLDTDHFSEQSFDFSLEAVAERIDELHGAISSVFWSAITEFAYEKWK
jgi:uncharacterized protein (TIGR04255 family)